MYSIFCILSHVINIYFNIHYSNCATYGTTLCYI